MKTVSGAKLDITCGKIEIGDIIACSLDLKKSEYRIFEYLLRSKSEETISRISKDLDLDRTTIQKILGVLFEKGLVARFQKNLKGGGYIFSYSIKEKPKLKSHIKKLLGEWHDDSVRQIDNY